MLTYFLLTESISVQISLATYMKRIRLATSQCILVCTAFAFVFLGYARHPAHKAKAVLFVCLLVIKYDL